MKKVVTFLAISSSLYSLNLHAENHALFLGGGGEVGENTLFDSQVPFFGYQNNFSKNTEVIFNGGHKKLEKILEKNFQNADIKSFNLPNYTQKINELVIKINNGTIKEKDQLLVTIFSHGGQMEDGIDSHRISLTTQGQSGAIDLQNLSGSEAVSLDTLKPLIEAAEKKGVKLGIIDQSCYGGATTNLAKNLKNVCILSGAGAQSVNVMENETAQKYLGLNKSAIRSFSEAFGKRLNNLEDVYLDVLKNVNAPATPLMSTENALAVYDKIGKKVELSTELYDFSANKTDFYNNLDVGSCSQQKKDLAALEDYFSNFQNGIFKNTNEYKTFINELKNYNKQKIIEANNLKTAHKNLEEMAQGEITFESDQKDKDNKPLVKKAFDLYSFFALTDEVIDQELMALSKKYIETKNVALKGEMEIYKKAKEKRNQMIKDQNSVLSKIQTTIDSTTLINYRLGALSVNVQTAHNVLKARMYEMMTDKSKSDPCRDFKLN